MKKATLITFVITLLFCCYSTQTLAGKERCPREAIHCVYNMTNSPPKWVRITMQPRNLTMILCLRSQDVVYLEKDDIEQDGTLPGSLLTWTLSQCSNKNCEQSHLLGVDQFSLAWSGNHYETKPGTYGFIFDPTFGETCTFLDE
ncbi:hypothetical protein [Legionella fairfieldensis]|uniref:hypothetical protein n=1 Tax=Legionella fairfieldensis TaxID=45064 RepID=UPI000491C44E|nr:hypothetical protein [Legionella fairfieldensis]